MVLYTLCLSYEIRGWGLGENVVYESWKRLPLLASEAERTISLLYETVVGNRHRFSCKKNDSTSVSDGLELQSK